MPGEEVLRRLRADPATRGIPVIVLSADATQDQISRLLAAGADDYLTKPVSVRTLLQAIDHTLGEQPGPDSRVYAVSSRTRRTGGRAERTVT